MSSSPASRNRRFRLITVALIFAISVSLTALLAMWDNDSSIASSPFANPGDVLIAGGDAGAFVFGIAYQALLANSTKSAQIYQISSNTFVSTSASTGDREGATGTALPDGTILVAGGYHCTNDSSQVTCTSLATAEIYDPVAGTFSSVGPMTSKRFGQSATLISWRLRARRRRADCRRRQRQPYRDGNGRAGRIERKCGEHRRDIRLPNANLHRTHQHDELGARSAGRSRHPKQQRKGCAYRRRRQGLLH